uniref:U4/U6 small nuclear ribonucleoprotein Prp31 n=1 Tax=Branchiostoma floridae TaxID=7739 RepID=C3Z7L6_BRAFL|eukprot:XP_002595359.1 hypothetical protein BRAFLDRAFT_118990 [Branchiostoma floridae]
MSLADELLADLEEEAPENEEKEIEDVEEVTMEMEVKQDGIASIAKLRDSQQLKHIMEQIDHYTSSGFRDEMVGPVEADPEYQLIVEANNLTVEIENEINIIHKFVRDIYSKRFPELESLVPMALDYIRTVREIGNDLEKTKNNEVLPTILTNATIMVVSVTASTTQGSILSADDLNDINEACDMAVDLNAAKLKIYEYVESRMSFIAPNLSIIVGASTAAKLMGVAGGLTSLSKMPSCNVLVLGAQKRTLAGFSSTAIMPHTGFIYYSEQVQNMPADLRKKAARLVSAKCTLAARVDSFHESASGVVGSNLKDEIQKKLDKWQEPPPVKHEKPLPAPIDPGRKKRGGRRYRKMKERLGMTEFRKQANRMQFAEIEEDAYQDDLGFSLGMVGKGGTGRVRGPQVDNKTQVKISKTLQKNLQKQQVYGGRTTYAGKISYGGRTSVRGQVSGTASSVAFTPLQGLEIVNPNAAEKKMGDKQGKYFSSTTGFVKVEQDSMEQ